MRCAVLRRPLFLAAAASAAALALPAVASADLVAAYDHAVPGSGLDIGMIDVNTGAAIPAPAGLNTSGDETHPSLTADGSTLMFERNGIGVRVPIRPAGATGTWSASGRVARQSARDPPGPGPQSRRRRASQLRSRLSISAGL